MSQYVFGKPVAMGFEAAVQRVTEELGKIGFGVLTDIDVQATMRKKIGLEMALAAEVRKRLEQALAAL